MSMRSSPLRRNANALQQFAPFQMHNRSQRSEESAGVPAAWVARRCVGGTGPRYEANNSGPAVPGVAFKPAFSPSFFRVSELETICDSMVGRASSGHCMQPVAYRILSK